MKKTLLLVFIHGFKGSDDTFEGFPKDLRDALARALPKIDILAVQYPKYETRGDLKECVSRFKEWLENKVIDLEVANATPSPTVEPSVHVVLCGHSMGGIVAAETLLSIAKDEPIPSTGVQESATNNTTTYENQDTSKSTSKDPRLNPTLGKDPEPEPTRLFFPYIQGVMAFDTPYLGISPGVLAHGAEEQINHASAAYQAFDAASSFFGFKSPTSTPAASPIPNAAAKGLPAPSSASNATGAAGWGRWGTLAMYGGAAAAIAGAAGAAYMNRGQIMEGFAWASSHLEFVGCLARGAELQKRVEGVVNLTKTHGTGFVNFYTALDMSVVNKSKYAGAVVGDDRTFCVIPKNTSQAETKGKRGKATTEERSPKRAKTNTRDPVDAGMQDGQKVHDFAEDISKSKGNWIKCMNSAVKDEVTAHRAMFTPKDNTHYTTMLPMACDRIVQWIDRGWYEESTRNDGPD